MASYATRDDVLLRAGRIGPAFSVAGKRPNLTDIDALVSQLSDEVDEAVRARGFDPAALDANAKTALLDVVAYGALARAVRALGDQSPEVQQILVEADAVWSSAMGDGTTAGTIAGGTFPAIAALLAGAAGGGTVVSAGSFWEDEPDYGRPAAVQREYNTLWGTNLAPGVSKGQRL
jgi:hypothetical protein